LTALGGVAVSFSLGCEYTPKTTLTVRDPSAVRVEIDEGKGYHTVLSPSSQTDSYQLPGTVPPYHEGLREKTTFERQTGGAIEVVCNTCTPERRMLMPPTGKVTLGEEFLGEKIDFTQSEMRLRFTDDRGAQYNGSWSTYEAEAVTPWKNVALVERVSAPSRAVGERLLITAAVVAALGGFSLIDGVSNHHTTTLVFGGIFLPVSAILAVGGGWYAFAPEQDKILFKGKAGDQPTKSEE
jgi:hypothetical protein